MMQDLGRGYIPVTQELYNALLKSQHNALLKSQRS
jgi:hypothetical protein